MREWGRLICIGAVASVYLLPSSASAAPIADAGAAKSPAEVREFWTPERMARAKPLDLTPPAEALPVLRDLRDLAAVDERRSVPASPSAYAATTIDDTTPAGIRTHGKVFGTIESSPFVCSGTVVTAPNESTVWTAAHCIYHTDSNSFATNFLFVPAYDAGAKPFGQWAAVEGFVTNFWVASDGDSRDDVGALQMQIKKRAKTAAEKRRCNRFEKRRKRRRCKRALVNESIQDKVGARGIVFNQDPSLHTYSAFGYPAEPTPRFDGEHLERCISGFTGTDPFYPNDPALAPKPIGISCDMQGGASGGGWVISGGRVNGNVSYGYPNIDPNHFFSPYFDNFTKGFYDAVKSRTG